MSILTNDMIQGLKDDNYKWYIEKYEEIPEIFPQIAEEDSTTKAYVQETVATGGGRLDEKPFGGEYTQISITEAWTPVIRIKEFGNILPIEGALLEDIEHKAGPVLKKWTQEWAESARQTKEYMVADLFNYGGHTAGHAVFNGSDPGGAWTDASGDYIYDSKPFFTLSGNERTAKNNDTYFNARSGLALNYAGIVNLYELIANTNSFKENGEKIVMMPNLLLVSTPTQEFTARRILESDLIAGSDHNDKNVIKGLVKVVRNPFLDSNISGAANSFVMGTAKKGVKIYSRIEPEFDFWEEKKSNTLMVRIRLRCGSGVTLWRGWASNDYPTS